MKRYQISYRTPSGSDGIPALNLIPGAGRYRSRLCHTLAQTSSRCIMPLMKIPNFTVVLTPDVTGGYVVTCPALPGLVTEGDTLEEARAMASDAIRGYLESLQKDGEPIPMDQSITEQLSVEVA
jgi:antitoxin HicB